MDSVVVQLISLIKSRPPIYKIHSKTAKNKEILDRLWREIASEIQYPERDCRRKWNILRNCYARTLRHERCHKIIRRPWYLQNELSFLKKYIQPHKLLKKGDVSCSKRRESTGTTNASEQNCSIDIESSCSPTPSITSHSAIIPVESSPTSLTAIEEPVMKIQKTESLFMDELHDNPIYVQKISEDEESNCSKISIKSSPNQRVEAILEVHKTKSHNELSNNSNQLFLTSLLPDLNNLSEKKQRIFKRKTIELLEILFEEDQYDTTMEAHYQALTSDPNAVSALPTVQVTAHHYDQPIVFTVTHKDEPISQ